MVKAGIIGATGYTGSELLRLLAYHPEVSLQVVTSRAEKGRPVADLFPHLRGHVDQEFCDPENADLAKCDVIFFATPNATAMTQVAGLMDCGAKIIDLSADFRLKDEAVWSKWYGQSHSAPHLLAEAVYGLPELNRAAIADARLVANPGCYPTAIILGLLPLLSDGCLDTDDIIADAKSGVSGAGRKKTVELLYSENADSMHAYGVGGHRHLPEIKQVLDDVSQQPVGLTFVPHIVPMIRGIHATIYVRLTKSLDAQKIFESYFSDEAFIDIVPKGSHPETRSVRGTNICRIAIHQSTEGNRIVILSVIDNLVKGAAGQAIQNMNLMFDIDEKCGLKFPPTVP